MTLSEPFGTWLLLPATANCKPIFGFVHLPITFLGRLTEIHGQYTVYLQHPCLRLHPGGLHKIGWHNFLGTLHTSFKVPWK